MKTFKYILVITLILGVSSCNKTKKEEVIRQTTQQNKNNDEIVLLRKQFEANSMQLQAIKEVPFLQVVQSNGMIDVPPENKAIVSAPLGGYIKSAPLLVGDKVKKGQLLVSLENPEFITLQQEYLEIKEQLTYLQTEFERQKTLYKENISSEKKFLKAKSDYKSALAKQSGLRKQLQLLNISLKNVANRNFTSVAAIYAPISGSISQVHIAIGEFVSPTKPILEITNNDHLHIELAVFEKDILKLKKEQDIIFTIPETSNEEYKAEVYLIGSSISKNRTVKVHGHLKENEQQHFFVGMFVEAKIITDRVFLPALPTDAVVEIDGKYYVLKLKSQVKNEKMIFTKVEVKIGNRSNGFTEIKNTSDFNQTDKFLTKGAFSILGE